MSPWERAHGDQAPAGNQQDGTDNMIYTRGGQAVDFGGKNASEAIAAFIGDARRGDKDAAYKVYQAESVCATNDDPVAEMQTEDDRKAAAAEREKIKKFCAGVSPAQIQERMHFLELAARAGNTQAQVDFYMEGPNGRPDTGTLDPKDPSVQQWRSESLAYLTSAGKQGDPFALGLLSTLYDGGVLGDRDPKMSMAYSIAENYARGHALSDAQLQRRYGKQLSESDFTAAQQLGAQIASSCCQRK